MAQIRNVILFIIVALLMISACGRQKKQPAVQQQQPKWTSSFDSLRQQYRSIHMAYTQDSTRMSPQAQQMYGHMRTLWSNMQGMKTGMMQMMGNGRMMNGRGMMGGDRTGRGMMGMGSRPGQSMMRFREMNQQMLSYCQGMQQIMTQENDTQMAAMYGQMINRARRMMSQLPPDTSYVSGAPDKTAAVTDGADIFTANCSSCHGMIGEGINGVFPPLNGSSIAKGDKETLVKIVLKGLQGPVTVRGETYNNIMPAFGSTLSDAQMAAVLTYLRSLSQNNAGEISSDEVSDIRNKIKTRNQPWNASELGIK
ncbi:MAG TPA: cytochrome c [Balneolales bacterium]|nr:cytochrome c [Balneolales bacterium]